MIILSVSLFYITTTVSVCIRTSIAVIIVIRRTLAPCPYLKGEAHREGQSESFDMQAKPGHGSCSTLAFPRRFELFSSDIHAFFCGFRGWHTCFLFMLLQAEHRLQAHRLPAQSASPSPSQTHPNITCLCSETSTSSTSFFTASHGQTHSSTEHCQPHQAPSHPCSPTVHATLAPPSPTNSSKHTLPQVVD